MRGAPAHRHRRCGLDALHCVHLLVTYGTALESDLGPVVIASGDPQIARAIRYGGGLAIDTDPNLPSGSDRVAAALGEFDRNSSFAIIVNLQGTCQPQIRKYCGRAWQCSPTRSWLHRIGLYAYRR